MEAFYDLILNPQLYSRVGKGRIKEMEDGKSVNHPVCSINLCRTRGQL